MRIDETLRSKIIEMQISKGYPDGFQYDCRKHLRTGNETLDCIVLFQSHYFVTGESKNLIPMVYRDIAGLLSKDISTIARAVEDRTYRMNGSTHYYKHLFKEGVLKDKNGREIAQAEFFDAISEIIENENKRKPYADELIRSLLLDKGYNIARRTVCKYRNDFLGIPESRLR
ncbi:hypothetical protein P0M11_12490 [Kaistella sp. PBT33-4]|uniref:RNA polymerase factor sigma-54 n=1 Tax=Kaistella sp. PBT33-4 TaxID=3032000 RepID=UPI0023D8738D|nr:hypothetical protein [Kaistella sp. PBT33-4]MDF0720818.1 hypothetical protein [Kaistella sp. PBT33-4]